jgi:hypothetical protein
MDILKDPIRFITNSACPDLRPASFLTGYLCSD